MVAEFGAVDTGFESGVNRVSRSMSNLEMTTNMKMGRVASGVSAMANTSVKDMDGMARGLAMLAQGFGAARLASVAFAAGVGVEAGRAINQLTQQLTGSSLSDKLAKMFGPEADPGGRSAEALRIRRHRFEQMKGVLTTIPEAERLKLARLGIDPMKDFFNPTEIKAATALGLKAILNFIEAKKNTPEWKIKTALWDFENQEKRLQLTERIVSFDSEQKARKIEKRLQELRDTKVTVGGSAKDIWGRVAEFRGGREEMMLERQLKWLADKQIERDQLTELREIRKAMQATGMIPVVGP
jgi:hypothetical protein